MPLSPRARPVVAIDGPAGVGKSLRPHRRLAEVLRLFVLVDTGAMYRAVALAAMKEGLSPDDETSVGALARALVARHGLKFARDAERGIRVLLDGQDVTDAIRAPGVGMAASTASAHPSVRAALFDLQRQAGEHGGVVLEGRDIGTVIFPDAEVKFFLTARADVRARRRFGELAAKGTTTTFDDTLSGTSSCATTKTRCDRWRPCDRLPTPYSSTTPSSASKKPSPAWPNGFAKGAAHEGLAGRNRGNRVGRRLCVWVRAGFRRSARKAAEWLSRRLLSRSSPPGQSAPRSVARRSSRHFNPRRWNATRCADPCSEKHSTSLPSIAAPRLAHGSSTSSPIRTRSSPR